MLTAIARGMAVRMRRARISARRRRKRGHTQNIFPIYVDHNRRRSLSVSALVFQMLTGVVFYPALVAGERARRNCEGSIHHNPMIYVPSELSLNSEDQGDQLWPIITRSLRAQ